MTKKQEAQAKRQQEARADREHQKRSIKLWRFVNRLWGAEMET